MPLMTVQKWQQHTSRAFNDRKNPLITDIDILLGEYYNVGKTDVQKLKLVILIRRYCREWLSDKTDKESSFRREYVDKLLGQTTDELNGAGMQQAMQQMKAGKRTQGKQMEEHLIELLQPRASAKEKWSLSADIKLSRAAAPKVETAWSAGHASTPMNQADIIGVLDFVQDQQQKGQLQRNLEYLQKKDRISFQLQRWPDGRFHRGGRDDPHSSPADENEMYAIDNMEYLYTANLPKTGGTFHHSSFLSGRPVLSAGEIKLDQGIIKHIDNGSGHYKPTTQHLLDCVKLLERRYRVDLAHVSIADHDPRNVHAKWASALHFLKTNGVPPRPLPAPPIVKT